jgi:SAM-dependent methyltransferase
MSLDDTIKEMERYYAERATWYDASMHYDEPQVLERMAPIVETVRKFADGQDILEVACGPGFWTQIMSATARSIVAVDLNNETLVEARKKTFPPGKVTLLPADAYNLAPVPGKFSAGFAFDWFSHVPLSKIPHFFRSFHSRLGSGARVLLIDSTKNEKSNKTFSRVDGEGNFIQSRRMLDPQTQTVVGRREIIKNFPSETQLREYVAGCAIGVEYVEMLNRWCFSYTVA